MTKNVPPPGKFYLLKDIPPDLHAEALASARAAKVPLRAVLLALLSAYVDGDIKVRPGKRRTRRGHRPGVSVHITQTGQRGEAVVQPQRFSQYLSGAGYSTAAKGRRKVLKPVAAVAPAVTPAGTPERAQEPTGALSDGLARLRALLG